MKMLRNKKYRFFGIVLGLLVFSVMAADVACADSIMSNSAINQKVIYTGVLNCYTTSGDKGGLRSPISLEDDTFNGMTGGFFDTPSYIVKLIGNEKDSKKNCYNLFANGATAHRLGTTSPVPTAEQKVEILEDALYVADKVETTSDACYAFKYVKASSLYGAKEYYATPICVVKDNNGKYMVVEDGQSSNSNNFDPIVFNSKPNSNKLTVTIKKSGGGKNIEFNFKDSSVYANESQVLASIGNSIASAMGASYEKSNVKRNWPVGYSAEDTEIENAVYYAACSSFAYYEDNSGIGCTASNVPGSQPDDYSATFANQISKKTSYIKPEFKYPPDYNKILNKFSNGAYTYEKLKFTDDEIYTLYYYYLKNIYGVSTITCGDGPQNGVGSRNARLWWSDGKKYSLYCYFDVDKKKADIKVHGIYDNDQYNRLFGKVIGLDEMITQLNKLNTEESPDLSSIAQTGGSSDVAEGQACYSGSGAIGWLVCPLIKMISGIGNSLWGTIEKSFMIIPARQIFNENAGVRTAWDVIRNIGNIFFVVLFMIVIFSQLTGVGIDNYGIKKILPKLILVAVLANLSWIICELAVDVSNIVGSGISSMLTNVATSIVPEGNASTFSMVSGGVGDFALAGGGAALFVLLNGWNLAGLAALGLAVLGVAISLLSGIIVMYVILIVRQAGVILLIALSPLAIVCYALPNTEKMFKRWRDLFKALLVVYPLCGAALGAGKLASAVLASIAGGDSSGLLATASAAISTGDLGKFTSTVFAAENNGSTGLMLAAMIVQVLPFFLIPKLLKSSLALMGNIGERISRTGRSIGRWGSRTLQSGVKNSDRFKSFQKFETEKMNQRRAIRRRNRNDRRIDSGLEGADRAEIQKLRDTIRSGKATEEDKKKYEELMEKSSYTPSDWRRRLVSESNATIRSFEQSLDKDAQGYDDVIVAGQMENDRYSSQRTVNDAYDWSEQLFVDGDNNTWVSDRNGNYVTVDSNGKRQTMSAAEIVNNEGFTRISRREAMLNKEYADRLRQVGQLAGWANGDAAIDAAAGAQLSSLGSSRSDVLQARLSGDDNVLQLQHDENTGRLNELQGRAQANAEFRTMGSTVVSTEAARQAAEERFANVIAQNNAAVDYAAKAAGGGYKTKDEVEVDDGAGGKKKEKRNLTRDEINRMAVDAATNKQISQKTGGVAANVAGVIKTDYDVALRKAQSQRNLEEANNNINITSEITGDYAKLLASQRFHTAQERMYTEQIANNTRSDSVAALAGALFGADATKISGINIDENNKAFQAGAQHKDDPDYIRAMMKDVVKAKGGVEDFNTLMRVATRGRTTDGAPAPSIEKGSMDVLTGYMATLSEEPVMKAYGKYVAGLKEEGKEKEIQTYYGWLTAEDKVDDDPAGKASLAGFIRANGDTVLSGASKDTFKFYAGDGDIASKFSLLQAFNGAYSARDNETRIAGNNLCKMIAEAAKNRGELQEEMVRVLDETTTSQWANMEESVFETMMGALGVTKDSNGKYDVASLDGELKAGFERVRERLNSSSATVKANMKADLRKFFDIGPAPKKNPPTQGGDNSNNPPAQGGDEFTDGGGI